MDIASVSASGGAHKALAAMQANQADAQPAAERAGQAQAAQAPVDANAAQAANVGGNAAQAAAADPADGERFRLVLKSVHDIDKAKNTAPDYSGRALDFLGHVDHARNDAIGKMLDPKPFAQITHRMRELTTRMAQTPVDPHASPAQQMRDMQVNWVKSASQLSQFSMGYAQKMVEHQIGVTAAFARSNLIRSIAQKAVSTVGKILQGH